MPSFSVLVKRRGTLKEKPEENVKEGERRLQGEA